jgi:Tfp pilus assembly protein PilX
VISQGLPNARSAGAAYVLTLLFLCVITSLGVALAASTNLNLQKAKNWRLVMEAQLAAESGLAYHTHLLKSTQIADSSTGQAVLDSLATDLADQLDGSALLQGQSVGYDGSTIAIPAIALEDGKSFSAEVTLVTGKVLRLRVVAEVPASTVPDATIRRAVSIEVEPAPDTFGYGMFAKGPIVIGSGFNFVGANDPAEASMASAAGGVAITVADGHIDGNVVTYRPDATVAIGATVGGQIICGADSPDDPQIDGSIFEPFATNTVDAGTDTSSGTFTNIRVEAGADSVFGNGVNIRGVMYIEAPNKISFVNNANITGVIVSEDPGPGAEPSEHYLYFKNNLTVHGLDELPDTPEFATLRGMAGSAFLLPGFTLEFKNNFSSVSGVIAAREIIAKNNLDGIVYGSIIALGDVGVTFKNNAMVTIDRARYPSLAPGIVLVGPKRLAVRPSSYTEH